MADGRGTAGRGHTFSRALRDGRGDGVAVVHGLLEAIWELLLLLVDLEVLGVLGLLVRQAVVLAGRVEGRHELMVGLGRSVGRRWAGKVRATPRTGGPPVFITLLPRDPGNFLRRRRSDLPRRGRPSRDPVGSRCCTPQAPRLAPVPRPTPHTHPPHTRCRSQYIRPLPTRTSTSPSTRPCPTYSPAPRPCRPPQTSFPPPRQPTSWAFSTTLASTSRTSTRRPLPFRRDSPRPKARQPTRTRQ